MYKEITLTSTSPPQIRKIYHKFRKFNDKLYCKVKKILNRNLIITDNSCVIPTDFKGTYFISKPLFRNGDLSSNANIVNFSEQSDLNSEENIQKILKARMELYRPTLDLNHILSAKSEKNIATQIENQKIILTSPPQNETFSGLIDFRKINFNLDAPEEINFNRISNVFYSHKYISHKGLILKRPDNSVLKLKINKLLAGYSFLRMIFSTNMENFYNNSINENTDYELLIHSENGIALKKISKLDTAGTNSFQFLDMDIRVFFHESSNIDIIFLNNTIYINSVDDDMETSVKIFIDIPEKIKFLSFDAFKSTNVEIQSMKLINFVEADLIYNIYVFENRMRLGDNSTYIEKMSNGDLCEDINMNRSTVVEYRCDKTGNHDIVVRY